jgi:hypothetical protein
MAAGSIIFDLLLRTSSFTTDSQRAEKRLKEMKKEAEDFGKAFGAVVVAGMAAATYAIKESINAMDDLSKAAQSVGTTTEALSALRYAADLSGVGAEQLDKALVKLSSQSPETAKALSVMGLSAKDANGNLKDSGVLLGEIAGKFAGYSDGANKTALAVSLFGEKIGAKMIPLLNAGEKGLADMSAEAAALGIVIDGDTAKAAEAFNDNLSRLGYSAKGLAASVATELLPVLNDLTEELVASAKTGGVGAIFGDAAKVALQTVIVLASDVIFVFKGIGTEIGGIAAQLAALGRGDLEGFSAIGKAMKEDAAKARAELDAFQARIMGLGKVAGEAAVAAGGVAAPMVAAFDDEAKRAKKRLEDIKKEAEEAAKAYSRLVDEGKQLTESVQTPAEKLKSTTTRVDALATIGVINPETQQRATKEAQAVYDEYVRKQREMLTQGLLSEEAEVRASYERRKQMILSLTEATEAEKAQATASLTEQMDVELQQAQYKRYSDLLSEEERVTKEYMERKRKIEDDGALAEDQRTAYLISLGKKYHDEMDKLDEADLKKRNELQQAQMAMVTEGFSNAADVAKAFAGEQSKEYQALFAMSKAFAIADITVKQTQAIAKAWGENNYWTAIGLTVGLAAQFAGLLSSANSTSFGGTRADGGSVNAGRSYLVGERGPEIFSPSEGGRIIPNNAMGGTTINVSVTDSGTKASSGASDSRELGRKIGDAVRAVIIEEKRPNGLLAA